MFKKTEKKKKNQKLKHEKQKPPSSFCRLF